MKHFYAIIKDCPKEGEDVLLSECHKCDFCEEKNVGVTMETRGDREIICSYDEKEGD